MDTFEYLYEEYDKLTGFHCYERLDELGGKGWEWVTRVGEYVLFKRKTPDTFLLTDVSCTVDRMEAAIDRLTAALEVIRAEAKAGDAMLYALVQALVQKFCPESELADITKLMGEEAPPASGENAPANGENPPAENEENAPAEAVLTDGASQAGEDSEPVESELVSGFADERIQQAMGYGERNERVMSLMLCFSGSVLGYLPMLPEESHSAAMLRALYRYYEQHPESPVVDDFDCVLNTMTGWYPSPEVLGMIAQNTSRVPTVEGCTDDFFRLLLAQQRAEKNGKAPFTVEDLREKAEEFVTGLKNNNQTAALEQAEAYMKQL